MIKIVKAQLLDIVPLEIGFIYAQRAKLPNGQETVAFFAYDQDGDRILPVRIKVYLEAKFGFQYREDGEFQFPYCQNPAHKGKMSDSGCFWLFQG